MPAPGVVPELSLPDNADGSNTANWYQAHKSTADVVAHVQKASRIERPAAQNTGATASLAFSAVSHDGAGAGTVTPIGGKGNRGERYAILIIAAGTPGTMSFQFSADGGKTYTATVVSDVGGTYTDPTTGVEVSFAGSFDIDDVYRFRGVDTPLQAWLTDEGKARALINHLGLPLGLVTAFREDWTHGVTAAFTPGSSDYFPGYARWKYVLGTAAVDPSLTVEGAYLRFEGSTTAAALANWIASNQSVVASLEASKTAFVVHFLVRRPVNAASQTLYVGLGTPSSIGGAHPHQVVFIATGTGNWVASFHEDGGLNVSVATGVAPTVSDWQLLTIERYGASTAIGVARGGTVWRMLIDGVEVAVAVGDVGAGQIVCRYDDTGNATPTQFDVGPIAFGFPWLDSPQQI